MKRLMLTLAAVAIVGLTANSALAGNSRGSHHGYVERHGCYHYSGGHDLSGNHHYSGGHRGHYDRGYRGPSYPSASRYSRGYRSGGHTPSLGMSHAEAVRLIMARHSRSRYHTHPRSLYNGPPSYR